MALNKNRKPQNAYSYVLASSWLPGMNLQGRSLMVRPNVIVIVI